MVLIEKIMNLCIPFLIDEKVYLDRSNNDIILLLLVR